MTEADRQKEIEKIEEDIRQLEELKSKGVMPAELADASIAALREKLATYHAEMTGDGAIAQGSHAKAVGKGAVLVEGNFQGTLYVGAEPQDDAQALEIYRRMIVRTTSSLPLRGVDVGASDPSLAQKSIGLANVYVDLDTTTRRETEKLVSVVIQKKQSVVSVNDEDTIPVLYVVKDNPALVLLGDPGGGKSTFVNFLAHCLAAHALEPQAGWLKHLNGWPEVDAELLPIPVILRDFARYYAENLPGKAEPQHLWDFIVSRLKAQNLDFAARAIQKTLEAKRSIVLLDGLDEVATQAQRIFVRDAIQAFMKRYKKNRYLVTCRVLSYQPPEKGKIDLRLSDLPSFEIASFNEKKIGRFVEAWYEELVHLGTVKAEDQKGLTARLTEAVARPDLKRLAPNPLLLTVMALVHTHKGRLPDTRALLYEETVDILLWRWEQIKLGGNEDAPRLRQYLLEAGRTDVDLKRALWELAYRAHAMSKSGNDGEGLADIPEHRILKTLATLKCDEAHLEGDLNWAQHLVDLMKMRAGLLLERQPEVFTFPHRTFQEYLAGAHLAAQINFAVETAVLAHKDTPHWREVARYAAGKLVYVNADVGKALSLVAELCPADVADDEAAWRLAWLAGEVMREIGLKRAHDSSQGRDLLRRVQDRLKDLLEGGKLAPRERAEAGDVLASLGDPRFDADRWYLPKDSTFGFVHIPAGKFIMGSKDGEGKNEERPQHEVNLDDFWMAKYPVTVAQYRAFVDAIGYKNLHEDVLRDPSTRPVRSVTWYDALAYCKWLGEQLTMISKQVSVVGLSKVERVFWDGIASKSLQVTLPSEAQWEKAARSADGRAYPWGANIDPSRANYADTESNTTSAVGCFPGGVSPYGLLDMSGNVWEWTCSHWKEYPYPEDAKERQAREDLSAGNNVVRVLRGGAFYSDVDLARCAYRDGYGPNLMSYGFGFRVVVSPFLPA